MNYQRTQKTLISIFFIAAIFLFIVVYIGNLKLVENYGGGQDFFFQWTNARTFLVNGFSPYQQEAQFVIKQNAVLGGYSFDFSLPVEVQPLYGLIIYFPFVLLKSFPHAFAAWLMLNESLLVFTFWLLYRLLEWKGSKLLYIFAALSVVLWKNILNLMISGSDAILFLFFIVAILYSLRHHMEELAGVLLAILSVKIYLLWIPLIFLIVFCIQKHYRKTIFWMLASLILVSASLMLLDGAWVRQYLVAILTKIILMPHNVFKAVSFGSLFNETYFGYLPVALESVFLTFGIRLGNILTFLMFVLLVVESASMAKRDEKGVVWLVSLSIVLGTWMGINSKQEWFVYYAIPLILFISLIHDRWKEKGLLVYWITPLIILGINWGVFSAQNQTGLLVFGFYPGLFLVMLYWIRWWALSRNFLVYE